MFWFYRFIAFVIYLLVVLRLQAKGCATIYCMALLFGEHPKLAAILLDDEYFGLIKSDAIKTTGGYR
jgi:hypothetical protein